MKKIIVYTDGACKGNPGPGGYAAILIYNKYKREITGSEKNTTNNRMELKAVIAALETLKEPVEIELYSDSTYVIAAIDKWLNVWKSKSFKKIKNVDLWKQYLKVSKGHIIKAHHVDGHTGVEYNERCDFLASNAADKLKYGTND